MIGQKVKIWFLVLLISAIGVIGDSFAQDSIFEVVIDRNRIMLGTSAKLTLEFKGGVDPGALELPEIEGFQVQYLGPSTKVTIINGNYSKTTSYTYNLFPLKVGTFKFPSLKVEVNGQTYASEAIEIEVVDSQIKASENALSQEQQEAVSLEDKIFLSMELGKNKSYLHERIPVTIRLYIQGLSVSDVAYPEFNEKGFTAEEFAKPKQYELTHKGLRYEVVEFNTHIYPSRTGTLTIEPASLQCNILSRSQQRRSPFGGFDSFFDNFFDTVEKHPMIVKSSEIKLDVMPFPEMDKPDNFSGAVGEFTFELEASPLNVKVGDPVTIRMFFAGTGNLNAVTFPEFKETDNFKVYEPQIKEIEGIKVIEQVLIPKNEAITELPSISFNYFDTSLGEYQTIQKGPIALKVSPAENKGEIRVFAPEQRVESIVNEKIGQDIVYIKEKPGKLKPVDYSFYKSISVKFIFAFITIIFILGLIYFHWRTRMSSDVAYARRLRAPREAKEGLRRLQTKINQGKQKEFYLALFKIFQDYLGNKFHLSSSGLTVKECEKILNERKINEQIINQVKELLEFCDQVRFASVKTETNVMTDCIKKAEQIIDYFERKVS